MASRRVRFDDAGVEDERAAKIGKKRSAASSDEEEEEGYGGSVDPFVAGGHGQGGAASSRRVNKRTRLAGDKGDDEDEEEDYNGDDEIPKQASLAAEGIAIEPFHMKNENSDGTGYFDGDTYVFRNNSKKSAAGDEEPDAWLDQLGDDGDDNDDEKGVSNKAMEPRDSSRTVYNPGKIKTKPTDGAANKKSMDDLSETDLYAKIQPHLGTDSETVMQAISRNGGLLKAESERARHISKQAFDDLTEAASAFMLRGNIDVYQMNRSQITRSLAAVAASSSTTPFESTSTTTLQWEYKGSADGQIHGPYTTRDMLNWIQSGYFVGSSAVQVRWIKTTKASSTDTSAATKAVVGTKEDLLADLMDDDDHDDAPVTATANEQPAEQGSSTIWGEWQMSDQVDFAKHLS